MPRQRACTRVRALTTSSAIALSLAAGQALWAPATAQEAQAGSAETITVTGSRIVRRDFQANSPIVTVDSQAFENQTGVNVESYLNQLPQFNPAAAPTTTNQDVQPTATNSVGIASISLRGLGANRNLVLVDGHRMVPINASMVTDINAIPSALIARTEIITGGASAVYGADAVGGVTNFILKTNFEGIQVDSRYSTTEAGDGDQFNISAVMGANSPDDKGNVTIGLEHYSRSAAAQRKRDFYTDAWADPYVGTNELFVTTHGYQATPTAYAPTQAAVNALFPDRGPGITGGAFDGRANLCVSATNCSGDYNFNPDGTIWTAGNGAYRFDASRLDGSNYATQYVYQPNNGIPGNIIKSVKSNNEFDYASSPQTRYSAFASGHYELSDSVEAFGRASYAESRTATRLIPSPAITGWAVNIPYNPRIDSPIDPDYDFGLNAQGQRITYATASATQLQAALRSTNPNFIPTGTQGAHFPVTPELALLLNSRNPQVSVDADLNPATAAQTLPVYFCDASAAPQPTAQAARTNKSCLNPLNVQWANALPTVDSALWGQAVGNLAPWQLKLIPDDWFADRSTVDKNTEWQLESGLRGDLPFKDWTWEAFISHGESATYNINNGNFSLQRLQGMIAGTDIPQANGLPQTQSSPWDYGRGAVITGNQGPPNTGFGAATATCQTGFYDTIFKGDVPPSADCAAAINAQLQGSTAHQQTVGEVNLQGSLFDLPAGTIQTAVGLQYRENQVQYTPDILQSTSSFIDQVVGVYPTAYMDAATYSQEAYAEFLVPVVKDLPFVQEFSLELGARFSDYAKSDDEWTYKSLGDWTVTDWLRLRGGYNRATRAPNIGELFLGRQQFYGAGGAFGDPCGLRSNFPFGAGGARPDPVRGVGADGVRGTADDEPETALAAGQTAAGAESTYLICRALMTETGANQYYSQDAGGAAGGGFAFLQQQGNPNLDSEKGDTWTFGGVLTSPFDNPWLAGLTASVDWYKLEITDAIQQQTVDQARFDCYGATIVSTPAEAQAWVDTGACKNTGRRSVDGAELNTLVSYSNQAHIETTGVDLAVNWNAQLADLGLSAIPGGVSANVQASFLGSYKTKASEAAFDPEIEWKGSLGPNLSGTNSGAFDYRVFTNLSYFLGDANFTLRWRHYPEVDQIGVAQQKAIQKNNVRVARGEVEGLILSYTPSTAVKIKKYDVFDLSGNYKLSDRVSLRAGIDNILNTPPVRTAESRGRPYDPNLTSAENVAALANVCASLGFPGATAAQRLGCTNPTGNSLPSPSGGVTSAGYYDILGRSFFVGLQVDF